MQEERHDALGIMDSKISVPSSFAGCTFSESYIVKVWELARNLLLL